MERFVAVARLPDIPLGAGLVVEIADYRVALFRVDGEVFATDNACIRCCGDLADGTLDGHEVQCAQCGWHYDVATGRTRGVPSLRLETFDVRTSDARVMLANYSGEEAGCR